MIELININKIYSLKNSFVEALDDVNFTFEKGKFYAIMGHSGCGKSTLLQLIGLLDKPTDGVIKIDGNITNYLSEKGKTNLRMKKIGFVFQAYYLNNNMKAFENVMLPMYINLTIHKNDRKTLAIELLNKLGLGNRVNHYPNELSGGEQQRIAIARALVNNPSIILADEPTGNLDELNEEYIFTLLKELSRKNICVIIASHNNKIKDYADEVIYLKKGRIGVDTHEV